MYHKDIELIQIFMIMIIKNNMEINDCLEMNEWMNEMSSHLLSVKWIVCITKHVNINESCILKSQVNLSESFI